MADFDFLAIDQKWQQKWVENEVYKTSNTSDKPKYYILDMFPYPSGAGLHVGHPLGYIASDILARYKKQKGFNVLHPMGFDAFGLPAEQYAIETGQHPAVTTQKNTARYKEQLNKIGLGYDWSREISTADPAYYKYTQEIFLKLFDSWYNKSTDKAEHISTLINHLEKNGTDGLNAACGDDAITFFGKEWNDFSETMKETVLQRYRLAFLSEAVVNWCPALGTVLANEEVKDGLSERGGHPVERKKMIQWSLRISAYAQRLLDDLESINWSESIKDAQRNWIGRSEGAMVTFQIKDSQEKIEVFTTRPDTLFGVSFVVLAPEHELVNIITTPSQKEAVDAYKVKAGNRSERERMAEVEKVSGEFTGAYVIHPLTEKLVPIWIGDYVLASYGTGAVMAVPSGDQRDFRFASHFNLEIPVVIEGFDPEKGANEDKMAKLVNSDYLNGLNAYEAIPKVIAELEKKGAGTGKINYRMRDAIFSRQRYWGEPIPVYFENGIPKPMPSSVLPLNLPEIDAYLPTAEGEPPLARAQKWDFDPKTLQLVETGKGCRIETTTMPGWAGSSWYFLRYMDPKNTNELADKQAINYWQDVDLYLGGAEHATGHLLYVRFWTKFLYDLGEIPVKEPAKKLVNQGMILGRSNFVYRIDGTNTFVSYGLRKAHKTTAIHVDVNIVENDVLDLTAFRNWRDDFKNADFILEDDKYICGFEVEKMSKRWYNVVNPDTIIEKYGADTFRMYEMFLGPLDQFKPWNTSGITGVFGFMRKFWNLFHNADGQFEMSQEAATDAELKVLHKTIKKIEDDYERLSFNTSVSAFMICVNELNALKCKKSAILLPLCTLLAPYAPHICEEIWELAVQEGSVLNATFPTLVEKYMVESSFDYPVSFNGKVRFKQAFELSSTSVEIEAWVRSNEEVSSFLNGNPIKKIIVVPGKIINIVM